MSGLLFSSMDEVKFLKGCRLQGLWGGGGGGVRGWRWGVNSFL